MAGRPRSPRGRPRRCPRAAAAPVSAYRGGRRAGLHKPRRKRDDRGMKARVAPASEKLIQDYLARVAEAALRLPKGSRMSFVNRTRARIEREAGQAGLSDPGRVMEVLAAIGEPEELVRQERARVDAAWLKRRSAGREGGQAGQAADA